MSKREFRLDILRVIGTLLVILAHISNLNPTVKAIRSFDVVLLVFVSGISFAYSQMAQKQSFSYKKYIAQRIKRLCVPTWITVMVILILAYILCFVSRRAYIYDLKTVIGSFLLTEDVYGSVGNVWIVRIYMLLAMIAPFLYGFLSKHKKAVMPMVFLLIACGELIAIFLFGKTAWGDYLLSNYILPILLYGAVYIVAFSVFEHKSNIKKTAGYFLLVAVCFAVLQTSLCISGGGFEPNGLKYPPRAYYLFYGLLCSLALWLIVSRVKWETVSETRIGKAISWLSRKSFALYLVHTVIVRIISWGYYQIGHWIIIRNPAICYCLVLALSIGSVLAFDSVKDKYRVKNKC